jgi:hypothetical protein
VVFHVVIIPNAVFLRRRSERSFFYVVILNAVKDPCIFAVSIQGKLKGPPSLFSLAILFVIPQRSGGNLLLAPGSAPESSRIRYHSLCLVNPTGAGACV